MIKIEENVVPLRSKNATYTEHVTSTISRGISRYAELILLITQSLKNTLILWKKKRTIRISYSGRETGTG